MFDNKRHCVVVVGAQWGDEGKGKIVDVLAEEDHTFLVPWVLGLLEGLLLVAAWAFAVKKYGARWGVLGLRRPAGRAVVMPVVALLGSLGFAGVYFAVVTALGLDSLDSSGLPEEVFGHGVTRLLNIVVVAGWALSSPQLRP